MTAEQLLAKHGIKLESTAPGQHRATCPRCSHARKKSGDKCLGVKIDDKGVMWHCMHCQWSGPEKGSGKQQARGEQWTILAEYIYRDRDNKPFLRVRKCRDADGNKQYPQYHWDGAAWAKGKPKLNGKAAPKIPYRLPELSAAPDTAVVYFCEGEKDADALAEIGFIGTTASEGAAAKWDPALTPYFKGRHVVILPDADKPGRAHGIKVAKAINGAVASLRILDLYPERDDGADASDWIAEDTAGAKLVQRAKEAPLWESPAESGKEEDIAIAFVTGGSETNADAEITRLAKLTWVEYGQQRKGAAQKLGITSVSILDKAVAAERTKLGLDGGDSKLQGQAISFPEPEPWPKPVNGAELLAGC
jgi:5S rRNA maturation endonuclease (ribonuclease M5)